VCIALDANCDPVLTNLGEKMSDDEVDELLKAVDTSSGEINYTGMLDRMQYPVYMDNLLTSTDLVRTILAN
jgi:hypothetical protein